MAATTLADIGSKYDLDVIWDMIQIESQKKNDYFDSGVIVPDALIQREMVAGGNGRAQELSIPIIDDLADETEADIGTADTTAATPGNVTTDDMKVSKQFRSRGWGVPDLLAALIGGDLMDTVRERMGPWWRRHYQRTLIDTTLGVLNSNIAGTGSQTAGDMVNAIQMVGAGTPGAANKVSGSAIIDATATLGDRCEELAAMAMHSNVYNELKKQQLIDFIPEMNGPRMIPVYEGLRVIKDDTLLPVADGNRDVYTIVFFAEGAFRWGLGRPKNAIEPDRKPEQGTGQGVDYLWTRTHYVIHPYGFDFLKDAGAAQGGLSPTSAQLRTAAKWDRPVERKVAKLAFLTLNI